MFLCRSLSFHPSFFSFYIFRQKVTDTVDQYHGARNAYRARGNDNRIGAEGRVS